MTIAVRADEARSTAAPVERILRLLEHVEELEGEATGALVLGPGSDTAGMVLVEGRRICWAVAPHMHGRMTDLLRRQSQPPLDESVLEALYQRCRDEGRPLGESLVASGLVSEAGLRSVLIHHTCEALAALCARDLPAVRWMPHRRARYDARFTFAPVEMLTSAVALADPVAAEEARRHLDFMLELGGAGAAFARTAGDSRPRPIAQLGWDGATVRTIASLGDWVRTAIDLCQAFDPAATFVSGSAKGFHLVGWRARGLYYVATCADPSTAACLVAKRSRGRTETS